LNLLIFCLCTHYGPLRRDEPQYGHVVEVKVRDMAFAPLGSRFMNIIG